MSVAWRGRCGIWVGRVAFARAVGAEWKGLRVDDGEAYHASRLMAAVVVLCLSVVLLSSLHFVSSC